MYPRSNRSRSSASWWSRAPTPQLARRRRQVVRGDRVLEQRLDARDEDPRPTAAARPRAPRPGPPSRRRRARSARRRGRSAARAPRPRPGRPATRELLGHAVADLGVAGDPHDPFAEGERRGEVRLGAVRAPRRRPACRPTRPMSPAIPSRSRSVANEPVAASSGGSADRSGQPMARTAEPAPRGRPRRLRPARAAPLPRRRVLDLGIDRGDVEVDAPRRRAAARGGREVGRDLFGDPAVAPAPPAQRRRRRSGIGRPVAVACGSTRRQPVLVRRMPSSSGGPSTSPGGRERVASASRSWNVLNRLAALLVPSRAQASTPSAAASSSSSSRCASSGSNLDRTWSRAFRTGSPMPTRSRLNFSVPSSSMIERRPLWPPWLPASRNRSLPNGRAKSSATTSRSPSGACSRASTLRTARPGVVHVGQRLDEGQVEAVVAAHRRRWRRRAAGHGPTSRHARPAGPARASRRCGASRRTAHPGFPSPTTTFTIPPRSADSTIWPESRPDGRVMTSARHRGRAARGWYPLDAVRPPVSGGTARAAGRRDGQRAAAPAPASPPPPRARRGPSRRCGGCRGSRGAAARRPADQRTSPVWPPRPAAPARSPARPRRRCPRGGRGVPGGARARPGDGGAPERRRPRAGAAGTTARRSGRRGPCASR